MLRLWLLVATLASAKAPEPPVTAVDCSLPRRVPPSKQAPSTAPFPFKLDRANRSLTNLLALLKRSPTARSYADDFEQRHRAGEFLVSSVEAPGATHCPTRTVACYYPETKTMYIDGKAELGLLAPTLLHEIVHALDDSFAAARAKVKGHGKAGDRFVDAAHVARFKAEREAYDLDYETTRELAAQFPDYYRAHPPVRRSDLRIVKGYDLSMGAIARYLAGNCVALVQ